MLVAGRTTIDKNGERHVEQYPATMRRTREGKEVSPGKTLRLAVVQQGATGTSVRNVMDSLYSAMVRLGYEVRLLAKSREALDTEIVLGWCVPYFCRKTDAAMVCSIDPIDGWGWLPQQVVDKNAMCDVLFGLSRESCAQIMALGITNVEWLPLGATKTQGAKWEDKPLAKAITENRDCFWFLTVGAMQPRKMYPDLVRAFSEEFAGEARVRLGVKATRPDKGWGTDCASLTRSIAGDMADAIVYDDSDYSPEGMAWLYRNVGVYATASAMEGWGLPPLEAMAHCCIVVATAASGHKDFVTEDNAVIIPTSREMVGTEGVDEHCRAVTAQGLTWERATVDDIRKALRQAYTLSDFERAGRVENGLVTATAFSWERAASSVVRAIQERGVRLKRAQHGEWVAPENIRVAILIPTLNYRNLLGQCLGTLGTTTGVEFEVIVCDDGSEDDTVGMVESFRAGSPYPLHSFRHEQRMGLPVSRDDLVAYAKQLGDEITHICFLDADIEVVDTEWLAKLCSLHIDGMSAPKLLLPNGRLQCAGGAPIDPRHVELGIRGYGQKDGPEFDNPMEVDHIVGACMFMSLDLWRDGYIATDHEYPMRYCDDTDLCLQMKRRTGEHCWYWPQASLVHHCNQLRPRTEKEVREHTASSQTSLERFRAKWYPRPNRTRRHPNTNDWCVAIRPYGHAGTSCARVMDHLTTGLRQCDISVAVLETWEKPEADEILIGWGSGAIEDGAAQCVVIDPIDGWQWGPDEVARKNKGARCLLGLSEYSCNAIRKLGVERVYPLPLGIDKRLFFPESGAVMPVQIMDNAHVVVNGAATPTFWFLTIAAIQTRKGIDGIVEAFQGTFGADEPVGLLIHNNIRPGSGALPFKFYLERLVQDKDSARIVYSDSPLTDMQLRRMYSAAGAYVSGSRIEGWGWPPMEAMACGTPVVLTNYAGHKDYATEENAYLVACSEESMASAPLEHGLTRHLSQQLVWGVPDIDDMCARMWQVYEECQNGVPQDRLVAMERTVDRFTPELTAKYAIAAIEAEGLPLHREEAKRQTVTDVRPLRVVDNTPVVSVVMPLYNYADMLPRAVASVRAQTYTNWELIIVDDGSTDGGAEVADGLAAQDKRIRVIRHGVNRRLPVTRNTGIAAARGRYVMFLDPDDEYLPHAIQRLLDHMEARPGIALCYGNFQWEDGSAGGAEPYRWTTLADHNCIPCQATMTDVIALRATGGNDTTMVHAEDWDQWLRLAAVSNNAVRYVGPEPLYVLHQHDRQLTLDTTGVRAHDSIVREKAVVYHDALADSIHVAHVSFVLHPHGAQEVLRQLVCGLRQVKHSVYVPERGGALENVIAEYASIHTLDELDMLEADVLHVHNPHPPAFRKWLEGGTTIPIVMTRHGQEDVADGVLGAVASNGMDVFCWQNKEGQFCIPNGIDYSLLPEQRERMSGAHTVVMVGRFAEVKRPLLFAKICEELEGRRPGAFRFFFVGGTGEEPLFSDMKAHLGFPICWIPECSHEASLGAMNLADTMLLTSESEGRPMTLLEARGMGLHCIASDVGGVSAIEGVQTIPVTAGVDAWVDAVLRSPGRGAPCRNPEHDGSLMATRYNWLYRSMVLRGRKN